MLGWRLGTASFISSPCRLRPCEKELHVGASRSHLLTPVAMTILAITRHK